MTGFYVLKLVMHPKMALNFWSCCSTSQVVRLQVCAPVPRFHGAENHICSFVQAIEALDHLISIPAFIILILTCFYLSGHPLGDMSALIVIGNMIDRYFPWECANCLNTFPVRIHLQRLRMQSPLSFSQATSE